MIKLFYPAKRELHGFFFYFLVFPHWLFPKGNLSQDKSSYNSHQTRVQHVTQRLNITCQSRFTLRPSLPSLPSFPSFPSLPSFPFSRGAIFLTKLSSHIGSNSKGFASSDFFESDITSYKKKEKQKKMNKVKVLL